MTNIVHNELYVRDKQEFVYDETQNPKGTSENEIVRVT